MKNSLSDLMNNLNASTSEGSWLLALDFFQDLGFHIINYGMITKSNEEIVGFHSNMNAQWMEHYMQNKYGASDPFANYVIKNNKSILYSKDGHSELNIAKNSMAEKIMNEASEYEFENSICIPIHNKFGELITGFNLVTRMNQADFKAMLAEQQCDILMAAAFVNNQMIDTSIIDCEMESWFVNPHAKHLLSDRELETLKWLSDGHRNDRIAEKMKIAAVTVNYHMTEVKRKLGAKTREQAVAIAYKKGLLR